MKSVKFVILALAIISVMAGCASKSSYERQNKAAEKSLDSL